MINTDNPKQTDNPKEEKNFMHPDKLDEEKVDHEIRKGAGSEETENIGSAIKKEDVPGTSNESKETQKAANGRIRIE